MENSTKQHLTVKLDTLSFPDLEEIRILENCGINFQFEQRKSFDEHYIIDDEVKVLMDMQTLVQLSLHFHLQLDGGTLRIFNNF